MLYVSNIIDENIIEVSDSKTLKTMVVDVNKLRTEGTKVFGLTQTRVVVYRDVEDFLTRYALRQKLANRDYECIFDYADNEVRVSGLNIYTTNIIDLEIPDFVDTIGDEAFQDRSDIRSVYIPDSVVRLGESCFNNCGRLEFVRLSQSLTHLAYYAFSDCKALKSIVLPEGITKLDVCCFFGCSALTYIVLPESITRLGASCFNGCTALTNIVLSKGLTKLEDSCFGNCFLLEDMNMSNTSIDRLSFGCFDMCRSLKSLELPSSLQKIGEKAFNGCDSLEEIRIPSLLNTLEDRTFYRCTNLRRLTIMRLSMPSEAHLKTIGLAFTWCGNLSTLKIEDIADNAISDIETFIRYFKEGVPSIKVLEIDKSVGVSLSAIAEELGIEVRLLEE